MSIRIPSKTLREIKDDIIIARKGADLQRQTGVAHSTLRKVVQTGSCEPETLQKIVDYMRAEKAREEDLVNSIIEGNGK